MLCLSIYSGQPNGQFYLSFERTYPIKWKIQPSMYQVFRKRKGETTPKQDYVKFSYQA
jgi:hypothetical protein